MYDISIIIPTYNEQNSIRDLILNIKETFNEYIERNRLEIIIVDDGSTDNTPTILKNMQVKIIRHNSKSGYGAALKTGLKNAEADFIGILDADGTYPPSILDEFFKKIKNYDLIIGIRIFNTPFIRTFGKIFLSLLASIILKKRIRDLNSGIRVFKRKSVVSLDCFNWTNGFSFTTTMTLLAYKNNLKILEIPFIPAKRKGSSKLKSINVGLKIVKMLLLCLLNKKPY